MPYNYEITLEVQAGLQLPPVIDIPPDRVFQFLDSHIYAIKSIDIRYIDVATRLSRSSPGLHSGKKHAKPIDPNTYGRSDWQSYQARHLRGEPKGWDGLSSAFDPHP